MSKKATIIILLALIFMLAACTGGDAERRRSDTVISISDNMKFDEAEWVAGLAEVKDIQLARNGESEYKIIIPEKDKESFSADAFYFSDILKRMTGSADGFEVITDATVYDGKYISLGETGYSENIDTSDVMYDGYVIKSIDGNIYIKASAAVDKNTAVDGVVNGIYGFAEDILGCMFVRDDHDYIPYAPTIYLDPLDITDNPDFAWRRVYQYEVSQNGWSKRIRSNGTGEKSEIKNDANRYWGTWCHSSFTFVDPDIYFETHPEYFAYIKGKRRREYKGAPTQLCLTNPDIYPIIENKLAEFVSEYPDVKYWDFSINDNVYYCECEECEKSYEKYGSRAGALLEILNKLARRFPDVYISTLAYTYTKDVPAGIVCEKNVNIVIAPIQTSQLYSSKFGSNDASAEAKRMIEEWSAICDNLFVWDYVVDFKNLLMPFPNFAVQKDNVEFYKANNVRSVFHQGSREKSDEFACLRSYLLARQLWDTDTDVNALIGKYVTVTYGGAADYIAEYIDLAHESVRTEAKELDLYDAPEDHYGDYLSNENIAAYEALIAEAMAAVSGDERLTGYVEEIKLNVLYAKMFAASWNIAEKEKAFEEFKTLAVKQGVDRPYEIAPPDMNEFIEKTYPRYLSLIKLYISLCVIGGVALTGGSAAAAVIIIRRKKAKKPDPAQVCDNRDGI